MLGSIGGGEACHDFLTLWDTPLWVERRLDDGTFRSVIGSLNRHWKPVKSAIRMSLQGVIDRSGALL